MEPSLEQVKEIIKLVESFPVLLHDSSFKKDCLTPNCTNQTVEDNAYFEVEDKWGGLEFYDYVVLKKEYVYSIDAFGDDDIFGSRVLKGSKDANEYVKYSNKLINLN